MDSWACVNKKKIELAFRSLPGFTGWTMANTDTGVAMGRNDGASSTTGEPKTVHAVLPGLNESVAAELPSEPKMKKIKLFGYELAAPESRAQKAFLTAGVFLVVLNGFGLPFMLPKLRTFLGAPYVPMKKKYVETLFDRVIPSWAASLPEGTQSAKRPLGGLRLVDFGSGDGRVVKAAADRGMLAVGYELNPYLVLMSRLRLRGISEDGQIRWGNAWLADFTQADIVTIYGRPGDGLMARFAAKCEAELPQRSAVVSHFFDVPGWERYLVQDVDGLKLYDLSLRRGASEQRVVE
eukprot:TRINITY_DN23599_c0_g1_i1.p1 TRINITY_DN23599_c0_g1~~TRINITY_DN23599_c0_g1_i1.p1  ORF type:complete len:294 (+),score=44.45 TRINITY_DN23599_c0_g1_i1:90-971(+)